MQILTAMEHSIMQTLSGAAQAAPSQEPLARSPLLCRTGGLVDPPAVNDCGSDIYREALNRNKYIM